MIDALKFAGMVYAALAGTAVVGVVAVVAVAYLRPVLSSRGELAEAPEVESIPDEPERQTCVVNASGLTEPEAACLRRNYLRLDDEDRYELDLTFASIVTPEEVEP